MLFKYFCNCACNYYYTRTNRYPKYRCLRYCRKKKKKKKRLERSNLRDKFYLEIHIYVFTTVKTSLKPRSMAK